MNILRWYLQLVVVVLFLVAGVWAGVVVSFPRVADFAHARAWSQTQDEHAYWRLHPRAGWSAAILLLALGALSAATLPRRERREDALSYTQEGAEVRVARRAVEDFISKLGREVEGVSDMSCWVGGGEELIQVNVHIAVDVGRIPIPEACQKVKRLIEEEMRNTLGFPKVGEIRVQVSRLAQSGPRRGKGKPDEEALPQSQESYTFPPGEEPDRTY